MPIPVEHAAPEDTRDAADGSQALIAYIERLLRNPDPANVAAEDLHTSMPRDVPFVYGELKAMKTANIMPGKIAVPS